MVMFASRYFLSTIRELAVMLRNPNTNKALLNIYHTHQLVYT
jgi:hypothetical protein